MKKYVLLLCCTLFATTQIVPMLSRVGTIKPPNIPIPKIPTFKPTVPTTTGGANLYPTAKINAQDILQTIKSEPRVESGFARRGIKQADLVRFTQQHPQFNKYMQNLNQLAQTNPTQASQNLDEYSKLISQYMSTPKPTEQSMQNVVDNLQSISSRLNASYSETFNKNSADRHLNEQLIFLQQKLSPVQNRISYIVNNANSSLEEQIQELSNLYENKTFQQELQTVQQYIKELTPKASLSLSINFASMQANLTKIESTLKKAQSFAQMLPKSEPEPSDLSPQQPATEPFTEPTPDPEQAIQEAYQVSLRDSNTALQQIETASNSLTQTIKNTTNLTQQQQQIFDVLLQENHTQIQQLKQTISHLQQHATGPQALNMLGQQKQAIQVAMNNMINSLTKLQKVMKDMTPEQQQTILEFQKLVQELMKLEEQTRTMHLIGQEFESKKEILKQFSQELRVASFTNKAQKDLTIIKESFSKMMELFKDPNKGLQMDKGPMPSLQIAQQNIEKYMQVMQKISNIKDIQELQSIQRELAQLEPMINQILQNIQGKLDYMQLSPAQKQALEQLRRIKNAFEAASKSANSMFEKGSNIEKQIFFVDLSKNQLTIGIYTKLTEPMELVKFIQEEVPQEKLTSEQRKALQELQKQITSMQKSADNINKAKNLSDLEKATQAFLNSRSKPDFTKYPNALQIIEPELQKIDTSTKRVKQLFAALLGIGIIGGTAAYASWSKDDQDIGEYWDKQQWDQTAEQMLNQADNLSDQSLTSMQQTIQMIKQKFGKFNIKEIPSKIKLFLAQLLASITKQLASIQQSISTTSSELSSSAHQSLLQAKQNFNEYKLQVLQSFEQWGQKENDDVEQLIQQSIKK